MTHSSQRSPAVIAADSPYSTMPADTHRFPPGIAYFLGNEAAERFSFHGMRAILVIFMTQYLVDRSGALDTMTETEARGWYHLFVSVHHLFPVLGAILADAIWGRYRIIIVFSIIYCVGHVLLSIDSTRFGLAFGLGVIAFGAGGIKPCIVAFLGDQFGVRNMRLREKAIGLFMLANNLGGATSVLITPVLLALYGPHVAFALPALLMFIALVVIWKGRKRYVHRPPAGTRFLKVLASREGIATIAKLSGLYVLVIIYWSVYDQTFSAWTLQAEHMDRTLFGVSWHSAQVQVANPVAYVLFTLILFYLIYPALEKRFDLSLFKKIGSGFALMIVAFLISGWVEWRISAGAVPSISWHFVGHICAAVSEIMVAVSVLEYSYKTSPAAMKALVLGLYYVTISLGNLLTSSINFAIDAFGDDAILQGVSYYLFFATLMTAALIGLIFYAAMDQHGKSPRVTGP